MVKTPDFKIEVNGKDKTSDIKKHIKSISLKDESDSKSDNLTLNFDNLFKRPAYNDEIKIWLGYTDELYFCGTFLVQTTTKNQTSISVSATSVDFLDKKDKKNESYENIKVCDLVKKLADRNGLNCKCNIDGFFKHIAQTNESDTSFLNRIAKMFNATFNIKNNTIIFLDKQDDLPTFEVKKDEVSNYSIKYANKTLYKSVRAIWHDTKENKLKSAVFGDGEPEFQAQDIFKDENEARNRAKGILSFLNMGIKTGNLTIPGRNIIAGGILKLSGFGEDDGEYTINSVSHSVSDKYTVRVVFGN